MRSIQASWRRLVVRVVLVAAFAGQVQAAGPRGGAEAGGAGGAGGGMREGAGVPEALMDRFSETLARSFPLGVGVTMQGNLPLPGKVCIQLPAETTGEPIELSLLAANALPVLKVSDGEFLLCVGGVGNATGLGGRNSARYLHDFTPLDPRQPQVRVCRVTWAVRGGVLLSIHEHERLEACTVRVFDVVGRKVLHQEVLADREAATDVPEKYRAVVLALLKQPDYRPRGALVEYRDLLRRAQRRGEKPPTRAAVEAGANDRPIDYALAADDVRIIWGTGLSAAGESAGRILAHERKAADSGGFAVFDDGRLRWVPADEFDAIEKAVP